MLRYTLKGLRARLRRAGLAITVVAAAVALLSGALVFADTVQGSFHRLFSGVTRGAELTVAGRHAIGGDASQAPGIPARLVRRLQQVSGVAAAAGQIQDTATIVGRGGRAVERGRLPTLALSYLPPPFAGLRVVSGRPPRGTGEVVLDARTATLEGDRVGSHVPVMTAQPVRRFRVVGVATAGSDGTGGQAFAVFSLPAAQALFGKTGTVDVIDLALDRSARPAVVAGRVRRLLPSQLVVRTRAAEVGLEVGRATAPFRSLTQALIAFAAVSVLVAVLLIFNVFSASATQRAGELAVLRALGATRGQVLAATVLEAGVIGLLGTAAGLVMGPLAAAAVRALFAPAGAALPAGPLLVRPWTLALAGGVGLVAALVAGAGPAARAARAAPLEALRAAGTERRQAGWPLAAAVVTLGAVGVGLTVSAGGAGPDRIRPCVIGGAMLLLATLLAGPLLVRLCSRLLAWPLRSRRDVIARLTREQLLRSPGRAVISASSLTIGLALVVALSAYVSGARRATRAAIERTFPGDIAIQSADTSMQLPAATVQAVAALPGLAGLSSVRTASIRLGRGGDITLSGLEPTNWTQIYRFSWVAGGPAAFAGLGAGDVLLERETARVAHLQVGDRTAFTTGSGVTLPVTVRGIYRDDGLLRGAIVDAGWFARIVRQPRLAGVFLRLAPGVNRAAALATLRGALSRFPGAVARSETQLAAAAERRADSLVTLLYGLLALSLATALAGIGGTLGLAIHERTRELGLMRALGMRQRQARRLVHEESLVTAAVGTLSGMVLGVLLSWVTARAFAPSGFAFAFPWLGTGLALGGGLIVGALAGVPPARRAARVDVLVALAHE